MAWNEIKWQFGYTLITTGRSRRCCDYNKGIYIYCLVGICIGDTVIFLQGTQFIHKAIARHCNCESFKCVFLLPPEPGTGERSPVHSAGFSGSGPSLEDLEGVLNPAPSRGVWGGAESLYSQLAMSTEGLSGLLPLNTEEEKVSS